MVIPEVLILPLAVGFWALASIVVLKAIVILIYVAFDLRGMFGIGLNWDTTRFEKHLQRLKKKTALKSEEAA
jgi:hypothetical protein